MGGLDVLFVCTGNICRSPIAERLARVDASVLGLTNFTSSSAGTRAMIGSPIHPEAALVLEGLGGESAGFAARQVTSKLARNAGLILTMERVHRDVVLELAPNKLNHTFTLREVSLMVTEFGVRHVSELPGARGNLQAGWGLDISDPIGRSPDVFAAVGQEIAECVLQAIKLCQRSA